MARRESRTDQRRGFTVETRIALVEADADEHDEAVAAVNAKLDRFQGILVGILITLTTASVLMALNLVLNGRGG